MVKNSFNYNIKAKVDKVINYDQVSCYNYIDMFFSIILINIK